MNRGAPTIRVNGESRPLEAETLEALLRELGLNPTRKGLAIALNGAVAPRRDWPDTALKPDDEIEIVRPARGG